MNDDFLDLLQALLDSDARFLVVGAHALAVHGVPRVTGDLDIWIDATVENANRVWRALELFGAPTDTLDLAPDDLTRTDLVVQIGLPPRRIGLLTSVTGVKFADAWQARTAHEVSGHLIPFLGRQDLIANKRATGRLKDLADLEALGEDVHGV